MRTSNPNFLNGVPELLVLQLLESRPMYGYELVKGIRESTRSQLAFGEGCIYPVLHDLEQRKLVTSQTQSVEGRSRHYYRLTRSGRTQLAKLTGQWERVVAGVSMILRDQHA